MIESCLATLVRGVHEMRDDQDVIDKIVKSSFVAFHFIEATGARGEGIVQLGKINPGYNEILWKVDRTCLPTAISVVLRGSHFGTTPFLQDLPVVSKGDVLRGYFVMDKKWTED